MDRQRSVRVTSTPLTRSAHRLYSSAPRVLRSVIRTTLTAPTTSAISMTRWNASQSRIPPSVLSVSVWAALTTLSNTPSWESTIHSTAKATTTTTNTHSEKTNEMRRTAFGSTCDRRSRARREAVEVRPADEGPVPVSGLGRSSGTGRRASGGRWGAGGPTDRGGAPVYVPASGEAYVLVPGRPAPSWAGPPAP